MNYCFSVSFGTYLQTDLATFFNDSSDTAFQY